jgi:hypothetical protein
MNKTVALIFSCNRAMQLDLCLRSLAKNCIDYKSLDVKILYQTSDARHEKSYQQIIKEYPLIEFIKEVTFHTNLSLAIMDYQNILFITDDTIFVKSFSINEIEVILAKSVKILAVSLRLGANLNYCYPVDKTQKLPKFKKYNEHMLQWDWTVPSSELDFAYALEVSSTCIPSKVFNVYMEHCVFHNPNQLESMLDLNKPYFAKKKYMLCYNESVAFANPINKVNPNNQNRVSEFDEFSIENLLTNYESGGRINYSKFENYIPNACHQVEKFDFLHNPDI